MAEKETLLLTAEEQEDIYHEPTEKWDDDFALTTVKRDFSDAENYLVQNHYQRWNNADRIYQAWTEQKYWEGTRVPRATPSIWLAFEQVESLLPIYMSTIFGANPFADAIPMPGTTAEQARDARDYIINQFDDAKGRKACRLAFKSAKIYGNGILEGGWESLTRKRVKYERRWKPVYKEIVLPTGQKVKEQSDLVPRSVEKTVEERINRPFLRYVSLRDFYIDKNCPSPDIQEARYVIKRCFMTVDELDALRDEDDFTIPDIEELEEMSKKKFRSQGDSSKSTSANYRGEYYQPDIDSSSDPASKRVEVLNYWTKDRCVWLLNREAVCYNKANTYSDSVGTPVIPFFNTYYTDVLDRFYALAITDIAEWDQRVIVSLLGGRLDELSLNLNPPRQLRKGNYIPQYQLRRRPGATVSLENPKDDMVQEAVSNVTGQAFMEVQASEIRTQKATGLSDVATMGTGAGNGNSANRTAAGINVQSQASSRRTIYAVENAETDFLEPILDFFAGMNRDFLDPNEMLKFTGQDGSEKHLDPMDVMNAVIKFRMRAGSRARSKQGMMQMVPWFSQTILNPAFMQQLAMQQQMTPNMKAISQFIEDATDYQPREELFTQMSQQQIQAMQPQPPQPPPPDPTKIQMQRERLQAQSDNLDQQASIKLIAGELKAHTDMEKLKLQLTAGANKSE